MGIYELTQAHNSKISAFNTVDSPRDKAQGSAQVGWAKRSTADGTVSINLSHQPKGIHHDRLVGLAVEIIGADMTENEDAAIVGLNGARVVGGAGYTELAP